jgi:hypothetical protein
MDFLEQGTVVLKQSFLVFILKTENCLFVLCGRSDNIIRFVTSDCRIFGRRVGNQLDAVKESNVRSNSHHPAHDPFSSRDILAIKVQGQFWCASIIKEAVMILD